MDRSIPRIILRAFAILVPLGLLAAPGFQGCAPPPRRHQADTSWIKYPAARRGDHVDTYHGVQVPDPYRWMEDESSPETVAWLEAQDRITERFFAGIPQRREVMDWLAGSWVDGVVMVPVKRGKRSFFFDAVEGKPHHVLFMRTGDGEPRAIFDLNAVDTAGDLSTETSITVSPGGRYVGYPIHHAGADAAEIRFYDAEAGREVEDSIPEAYAYVTDWLPDDSAFFYTYLSVPTMQGQEGGREPGIYRHLMGTPFEEDALVYRRPWEGRFMAMAHLAEDGTRLLIHDMNIMGSRGGWGVRPVGGGPATPVTWLIDRETERRFAFVGTSGQGLLLLTDLDAPNWRIVEASLLHPGMENLREIVPEQPEPVSMAGGNNEEGATLHEGRLYVTYIEHNSHAIRIFDLDGREAGEVPLPDLARVSSMQANQGDPEILIGLQTFLRPPSVYAWSTETGTLSPRDLAEAPPGLAGFEVARLFYTSGDGTRVPMSVVRRRGAPRDGTDKVFLYGYGGWGLAALPRFDNRIAAWLHMGGTYALANLRGGGEYGEAWHEAGRLMNKQNVFDDLFAAAEFLVREKYTAPSRIAIIGWSNGGLLTAAAYNQRPELFGAVVSELAPADMLRIQGTPIGATATAELGSPDQSREVLDYLLSYSPLHTVSHGERYPPMLNMVAENDPRCKPGHIYKYVAELQAGESSDRLALLRLVRGAGHESRRKDEQMAWFADELAFAWAMTE